MPYPVHTSCVDDRVYTVEEFLNEVFTPWNNKNV